MCVEYDSYNLFQLYIFLMIRLLRMNRNKKGICVKYENGTIRVKFHKYLIMIELTPFCTFTP